MQCPTCGNDTPGTLGKCSHCAAPIDVYSVGPSVPLAAPVTDAPPAADGLGDRTMMVPPPTPSWAADSQRPTASGPAGRPHSAPAFSPMPGSPGVQPTDAASAVTPSAPMGAVSAPGAPPPPQVMPGAPAATDYSATVVSPMFGMSGSADTAGNPTPDAASAVFPGSPMGAVSPSTPGSYLPPAPRAIPGNDYSASVVSPMETGPTGTEPHAAPGMSMGAGQAAHGAEPYVPGGGNHPAAPGTSTTRPAGSADQAAHAADPYFPDVGNHPAAALPVETNPTNPNPPMGGAGQTPHGAEPYVPDGGGHPATATNPASPTPSMGGVGQAAHGAGPHGSGAAGSGGFSAPGVPPAGGASSMTAGTPMGLPVQGGAGADPEDTAAWTFDPDEDDDSGSFGAVQQPGWEHQRPALPAAAPPIPFGLQEEPPRPTESIVPDSWFAQPRRPDADATQVQPPAPPEGGTQFAPAPMMNPGFGGGPVPGSPMGAPPPMGPGAPNMMGPGGPAYGHQAGAGKPGGGGPSKPLIAVVAALVTVAAGAVVFVWPSGGDKGPAANTTPVPSTSASNTPVAQQEPIPNATKQQAAALNAILNDSSNTRQVLAGAIGRADKCKTLPQAIQGFETVAQRRQNQLHRTRELQVDRLANGERLRGTLAQALQASLDVDLVLLRWAQANQRRGCKGKPKPAAAQVPGRAGAERRATSSKIQFVKLWNPVATKTGQPKRSWKLV